MAGVDLKEEIQKIKSERKKEWKRADIDFDRKQYRRIIAEYLENPQTVADIDKEIKEKIEEFSKCPFFASGQLVREREVRINKIGKAITFINKDVPVEKISGVIKELIKEKESKEDISGLIPAIELPKSGKLISTFANEIANILKDKNLLFFRNDTREVVEIGTIETKKDKKVFTGFIQVKPGRFITLAEMFFVPGNNVYNESTKSVEFKEKSMGGDLANTLLQSQIIQEQLPKIERIFTVPLPIIYDGKLTFPTKGYDERFNSWLPFNVPDIKHDLSLEESKKIIEQVFNEFCFQTKQDKVQAIAALITPYLRGLYKRFNARTPLNFYIANRERAGKDFCAGITGIVYEGSSLEEPPICDGNQRGGNSEELRKKILASFIAGRKRLHFSNNKGYINNPILEGILTSERHSDRILGRNENITFDNEMEFSLSGNVGIGFTPDLANRARFIRLFLDVEDANARHFEMPDLHGWVKENRGLILSAIYGFVNHWVKLGCPEPKEGFASYPEWARVCGGVMESVGYESPCKRDDESLTIGGDSETTDMKRLFELCYEKYPNIPITKDTIKESIKEEGIFSYFNFEDRSDQTKFGHKMIKFIGRVLSNIRMNIENKEVRPPRYKYVFTKEKTESLLGYPMVSSGIYANDKGKIQESMVMTDSDTFGYPVIPNNTSMVVQTEKIKGEKPPIEKLTPEEFKKVNIVK